MEKTPYLFLDGSTPIEFDRTSLCNLFEEHKDTHFIYDTHREHELVMWLKESVWYLNESLKKSNSCFTVIIAGNWSSIVINEQFILSLELPDEGHWLKYLLEHCYQFQL